MSNRIFQAVWDNGPQARSEMIVLMVLADCADAETGTCFPSKRHIARNARMSIPTVKRVLAALVAEGWIQAARQQRPDGSSTSNIYAISFEMLGLEPVVRHQRVRTNRGVQNDPPRVQNDPPGGLKMTPHGGAQNEPPITNHIEKGLDAGLFQRWLDLPMQDKPTFEKFRAGQRQ